MRQDKTGKEARSSSLEVQRERTQPYKAILFFALVGSSVLFLSLVVMFIVWYTHNEPLEQFAFPKSFVLSTLALLFSSYTLSFCHRHYKEDHSNGLLFSLAATLFLSGLFVVLQVYAWKSIYDQGFHLNGNAGITFLYSITGLHFLHTGAGMIYLFYLNLKAFDIWNDPVRSLLYFSNQFEGMRLELFSSYWHFINVIWLFLFLTFLFSF
ncbi:MAG: cytochrome c oxidase subunit 3 [Bacteroidia bacterium]|nr:cytochrome c oxidase subunit 3 [Bacteroidia bacterium]